MTHKALFDDETKTWESLYRDSSEARWGVFQSYARRRTRARMELCLSLLPPLAGKEVIELGCGPGYYGMRLIADGARWTGLDISEGMLAVCQKNTRSERLVRSNVLHLSLRPGCCDILLCIGVVSYFKKIEIASLFSQAFKILRPGGVFLTQTVRFDPLTWIRCRLPRSIRRPVRIPGPFYPRNPNTITRLLEDNGLSTMRIVPYRKFLIYPAGTVYAAKKE
ncbi:MAG: class I SAM-dependent methyltransferase [Candidatus Aureabacteria bacterium]|nr:class I SAM-dependent methyltransferase [Candidatus Auribacterota bacterium]